MGHASEYHPSPIMQVVGSSVSKWLHLARAPPKGKRDNLKEKLGIVSSRPEFNMFLTQHGEFPLLMHALPSPKTGDGLLHLLGGVLSDLFNAVGVRERGAVAVVELGKTEGDRG